MREFRIETKINFLAVKATQKLGNLDIRDAATTRILNLQLVHFSMLSAYKINVLFEQESNCLDEAEIEAFATLAEEHDDRKWTEV